MVIKQQLQVTNFLSSEKPSINHAITNNWQGQTKDTFFNQLLLKLQVSIYGQCVIAHPWMIITKLCTISVPP